MTEKLEINDFTRSALDVAYIKTAGPLLKRISLLSVGRKSEMQQALAGLDAEAARLAEEGLPLEPDNANLEKALAAVAAVFVAVGILIAADGSKLEQAGQAVAVPSVTAKVFGGFALDLMRKGIDPVSQEALGFYNAAIKAGRSQWIIPGVLDFAQNFVETQAWIDRMEGWGPGYAELINKTVMDGIAKGWGPKAVSAAIRKFAQNIPASAAENLTRTLMLTAYREAALAMETMNGGFIVAKVRIAKLDSKTCLSCIALHGTVLQKGERIDDHYRGRCSEWYRVPGGPLWPENMQADSLPGNRRFVPWQTGAEWFNSLSPERQASQEAFIANPAMFRAFQDGVGIDQFVAEREDSVFGRQVIQASLLRALGADEAARYYSK